ncbi:MAG: PaaI family thioesterase [Planctomycetota bacterium]
MSIDMKAMPFAELLAIQLIEADPSKIVASLIVRPDLCTTGQSIHGGALMAFADSIAATGAFLTLPEGAIGTTTIESKTNFLGAASVGTELIGTATPVKIGSRVSVWQTAIRKQDGKQVALTTQTQLVLK